jgi:hypothetical protein
VIPLEGKAAELPKIEPACSMCIEARKSSKGREFWCVEHRNHHGRLHTYHQPQPQRLNEETAAALVDR